MFKDIHGTDCFIDLEGRLHHTFISSNSNILSIENILKNYRKPDQFGSFFIKQYNKYGHADPSLPYLFTNPDFLKVKKVSKLIDIYYPYYNI